MEQSISPGKLNIWFPFGIISGVVLALEVLAAVFFLLGLILEPETILKVARSVGPWPVIRTLLYVGGVIALQVMFRRQVAKTSLTVDEYTITIVRFAKTYIYDLTNATYLSAVIDPLLFRTTLTIHHADGSKKSVNCWLLEFNAVGRLPQECRKFLQK